MKATFSAEFFAAAKQGPRLFFAPLVGAINAVRSEARRLDEGNKANNARAATSDDREGALRSNKQ